MSARDIVAALSVAIVWGLTFIAIKVGVGETTPLMLAALRFFFAAVPMVFFLAPPKAPAWAVVLYGLLIGVGQFGVLFIAVHEGFPVGLSSLVIQAQVFFTILLAWGFLGERPSRAQIAGAAVGFVGMAVIGSERLAGASVGPFLMVVVAAAFWGAGNVLAKSVGKVHMLAFTVWSSLAAPLPLLLRSRAQPASPRSPIRVGSSLSASPCFPTAGLCSAMAYGRGSWRIIRRRPSPHLRFWCRLSA